MFSTSDRKPQASVDIGSVSQPTGPVRHIKSSRVQRLILLREYIFQFHLQPVQDRLQFVQRDVVLAAFKAMKCGV